MPLLRRVTDVRLRLFVLMALQLAIWGAWAPKLFPYMTMLDFLPWQQSLVGSAWGLAAVVGIFFSNQLADRKFAAERFLAASHLLGGLALAGCALTQNFWPFFACFMTFSILYVPTLSVSNSIAFANLAHPAQDFGAVRMGGTAGWIAVSWPFVFLLDAHSNPSQVRWIFLIAAALSFVLATYSLTLPHTPPKRDAAEPLAWRKAAKLLSVPFVGALFLVTFIDSVIHNGYFVMADAFLTDRVGIDGNLSMVLLSLGQLAEMLTMFLLGAVLVRLGWRTTLTIGLLAHAARFAAFAIFADSVPVIIAVQFLHGVCYAFFFATVYIFVDASFPQDVRTSAQGLFNLLILGIGNVVASFLFPALVDRLRDPASGAVDYQSLFLVPSFMALLAAILLVMFFHPPSRAPVQVAVP
jgi:MFS family permease